MEQADSKNRSVPPYAGFLLFCRVFERQNLGVAADDLRIPHATASHMLAVLRDFFGDPLFLKTRNGFCPTDRAEALYPRVASLVSEVEGLAAGDDFDLSKAEGVIRIACADNAPYMLFGPGLSEIAAKAPGLSVAFETLQEGGIFDRLERKELDFAVCPIAKALPPRFHSIPLAVNRYVLVARRGHPLEGWQKRAAAAAGEGKRIPDSEILRYSFIDISMEQGVFGGRTLREWVFPAWGAAHSVLRSPFFLSFVHMLEQTDVLMVLPERTARSLEACYEIQVLETESRSIVNQPILIWHDFVHASPLHQWLRSVVVESCKEG